MLRAIAKLFSIAPGEGRRTALLYTLHLVFYLGLMWGDAARESLFLSAWKADDLALVFVAYAVLGFIMGLAYTFVADRISNGRLLKIILWVMILWLLSVRILLETHGGPRGAVYPYFYLAYSAFRDVATLHILIYINDFYDTRAAKRALPLMLSAGIAGGMLAGFTAPWLTKVVGGLNNTPWMWIAALAVCILLVSVIERRLHGDLEQIERRRKQAGSTRKNEPGSLENLRKGFEFVRKSGLLRVLGAATFAMVILMNLLNFQSSQVFAQKYPDQNDLFAFYSVLNAISNAIGLTIQSLLLSRLVAWLGVGTMNLVFPFLTLGAIGAINAAPGVASAIFARLNFNMFKQTFRNPLDAMLYNSVPITQKARSRGFVNGVIVPAGTLFAGLIVLAVRMEMFTLQVIGWIGLGIALLYLLCMFTVRREYARSMTSLLAGEELSLFQQDTSEMGLKDPATIAWLKQRLASLPLDSSADGQAVFISQMLYDMEPDAALPLILRMVEQRSVFFRKGIIEYLDQASVTHLDFIRLCQHNLNNPEPAVREAATTTLLNYLHSDIRERSAILPEDKILNSLFQQMDEMPLDEQARLVILLLRRGAPAQKARAHSLLDGWLSDSNFEMKQTSASESPVLEAGLLVLAEIKRQEEVVASPSNTTRTERFKALTGEMLDHPDPYIRRQTIVPLVEQSRRCLWNQERWVVQFLTRLLDDPEESIRLAVIEELEPHVAGVPFQPILWKALNDPSIEIRKEVCNLLPRLGRSEINLLWKALDEDAFQKHPDLAESAVYLLRRVNQERAGAAFLRAAASILCDAYWLVQHGIALKSLAHSGKKSRPMPGVLLMANALQEDALLVAGRLLWLLSSSTSEEQVQAVRRALLSSDPAERANAVEALEATLLHAIARQLQSLLDGSADSTLVNIACEIGLTPPSVTQTLQVFWQALDPESANVAFSPRLKNMYADGWLTAAAIHLLKEAHAQGRMESDLSISIETVRAALEATLQTDQRPNVHEISVQFLDQIKSSPKDLPMSSQQPLTLIEKVIFLKGIPFFADLPFREISILAGISEEVSYPAEHRIFSEGDTTKSLYLIVRGRVSVQQQKGRSDSIVRLAALGAKSFFAETSLFDGAPHQADVVTIEPVDILLIRQSALFTLVRRKPDIGLSLLKSLSQRLRETYAQVAQNERAKSQALVNLFDKLEG